MKKRVLALMTCTTLLIPTSGFCMDVEESGESKWYQFRVLPKASTDLKSWEIGVFSEENKLYCKTSNKKKIEITESDDLSKGLDGASFNRILEAMNEVKNPQGLNVAFKQEEEQEGKEMHFQGMPLMVYKVIEVKDKTRRTKVIESVSHPQKEEGYETHLHHYTEHFTKITRKDREKLVFHLLMRDYIQPGTPEINSQDVKEEVWSENLSVLAINPRYHIGTLDALCTDNIQSADTKNIKLKILYNTMYTGKKSFSLYLQDAATMDIIPLSQFDADVQPKKMSIWGIAFTKMHATIPSSIKEGIFLMTSQDIEGGMDWRMESHSKVNFTSSESEKSDFYRFIHRDLPFAIEYEQDEKNPQFRREVNRWNNDDPVKIRDNTSFTLEVQNWTYDYGCSFLSLYVDEKKDKVSH